MKKISIIVAMGRSQVIGIDNKLPWHISEDLKRFKKITLNHSVIMGRKTYDSIGKPLINRENIVITRDISLAIDGVITLNSLESAIDIAKDNSEIFIIGGEQIYSMALPIATHMYVTEVDKSIAGGNAFFPSFIDNGWSETKRTAHKDQNGLNFSFVDYVRV